MECPDYSTLFFAFFNMHDHVKNVMLQHGDAAIFNGFEKENANDTRAYSELVWSCIPEIVILGDIYFQLPFQGGIHA